MGAQQLMLLAVLLFSFCSPASFSLISNNLVSEKIQDNSIYVNAVRGGGGGGGGSGGVQEGGDGGQANSSPQGGGNGVVPVYAAGAAAGQRRNHKGAASTYNTCWKWRFAILIATSASLLHITRR
ncbi:unnamed protein product [Lactuca virosa]|uniref:Glycine-rich protein n=1 Tax=Lactuca virosa TaxID=75947 RepID=A0AAU9P8Q9_9ASTR|nr:unnamed protein product [Lactuca virosa]